MSSNQETDKTFSAKIPTSDGNGLKHHERFEKGTNIVVQQKPGFLCHVSVTTYVNLSCEDVYVLLTHPDNHRIFKNQKACTYRRIVQHDGKGKQTVEVEHVATWRVLLLKGELKTKLIVDEDDVQHTMDFRLAEAGIMKCFTGRWVVKEVPGQASACVATLEQDVAVSSLVPPPLYHLFKVICVHQIRNMVGDIQKEADKMRSGHPTLGPKPKSHPLEGNGHPDRKTAVDGMTHHSELPIVALP